MNTSVVIIIVLLQIVIGLTVACVWLAFKEKIKKRLGREKIEAIINLQVDRQVKELADITLFLESQLKLKTPDSEEKSKEILQDQRELLKSMIRLYLAQEQKELDEIPNKIQSVLYKITRLKVGFESPLVQDDILIDPTLVTSKQELEEKQFLLNNTLQVANKLLVLFAQSKGKTLEVDKQYDLNEIQEQILLLTADTILPTVPEAVAVIEEVVAAEIAAEPAPVIAEVIPELEIIAEPIPEVITEPLTKEEELIQVQAKAVVAAETAMAEASLAEAAVAENEADAEAALIEGIDRPKQAPAFDFSQFAVSDLDLESDLSLADIIQSEEPQAQDAEKAREEKVKAEAASVESAQKEETN